MELTYDWLGFQSVFYPKRRYSVNQSGEADSPAYAVVEDGIVISAFAEAEDLSEWIGATYQDMAHELAHRDIVLFDREKVDTLVQDSLAEPHFYDQMEFLAHESTPQIVSGSKKKKSPSPADKGLKNKVRSKLKTAEAKEEDHVFFERHFLLEAIQGWWAKVLPSAYGIFIRLEGQHEQDLLVLVRRGRIDSFQEPELASMGPERRRQPADVVKYLSEKHLVPVQGLFISSQEWKEWGEISNPWKRAALAVRANRAKLVPFRWGLVTMIATRGFLSV